MKFQLVTLFIVFIGLSSCKKSSSDPEPDFSATLTAHSWIHNGITAIVDGQTYIGKNTKIDNTTYEVGPDVKAIYTFKSDGTYTILRDDPDDLDEGKWTLVGNTFTVIESSNKEYNLTLTNKNNSGFTLLYPEVNTSDQSDIAKNEVFAANLVLGSNGLKLSSTAKKVQILFNLIAQ